MDWFIENWELIASGAGLIGSLTVTLVLLIIRLKAIKNAKNSTEREQLIAELKSDAYGLVAVAEQLFADIPKSGASKLLYVLNHIEALCKEGDVEFDGDTWTEFINGIVNKSNDVIIAKETEKAISGYIAKVKEEVPYFIADADKLFEVIPDSAAYKTEYILKLIANACAKHTIDVFDLYDWREYVTGLYNERMVI